MTVTALDPARIERFALQVLGDQAALIGGVMTYLGDRLGLYRALAGAGPTTPVELAERTGCAERYVREWLASQAAAGYLETDATDGTFALSPEHAAVLAVEDSPAAMVGGFHIGAAAWADADRLAEAFRSGAGIGWDDHDPRLYAGTERFFAAGYRANIVDAWLPALDGVVAKLERGARVLDVGCGHGASTLIIAEAFPRSTVVGIDYHARSIEAATQRAADAGLGDRVAFRVADAGDDGEGGWDLICFFDVLHDLGDPVGAAARARRLVADDGTLMVVEPRAGDRLADNLHPLGRLYYAASTALCTANALSQRPDGPALGAQAGPARLTEVLTSAGWGRVRQAAETPVNIVLEGRP